jgi:hypothetical protein
LSQIATDLESTGMSSGFRLVGRLKIRRSELGEARYAQQAAQHAARSFSDCITPHDVRVRSLSQLGDDIGRSNISACSHGVMG